MKIFVIFLFSISFKVLCVDSKPLIEELLTLLLPDIDYPDEIYPQNNYPGHNNFYHPGLKVLEIKLNLLQHFLKLLQDFLGI